MKNVITIENQQLIDIALQELGDVERVFELALLNGIGVTNLLTAGTVIKVPDYDKRKSGIVQVFSDESRAPASASGDEQEANTIPPGGIGYMQIGNTFRVS